MGTCGVIDAKLMVKEDSPHQFRFRLPMVSEDLKLTGEPFATCRCVPKKTLSPNFWSKTVLLRSA